MWFFNFPKNVNFIRKEDFLPSFEKSSLVLQYHDILQEIDPPDVLDVFWSHIDYQNIFRIDFGKIDFFRFLTFWFVGQPHKNFKIYRFGYKKT